jgi:membrane protease YdiL (CAAX protease family)
MTAVGTSTAGDGVARLLLRYVLLTYGISWLLWGLALGAGGAAGWVLAVAAFGPAVAAGLVVRRSGGSLRGWLRPLLRWRVPVRYWAYALGLPVVLFGSVGGVLVVSGDQVHLDQLGPATVWIVYFILVWLPTGAGEELGWRGLALDLLQARHSPLAATVLLGLIWGGMAPAVLSRRHFGPGRGVDCLLLHLAVEPHRQPAAVRHPARALNASQSALVFVGGGPVAFVGGGPVAPAILGVMFVGALALVVSTRGRLGFDDRPELVAERVADLGVRG